MKIATAIAALALVSAPSLVMAAPGSCERVKSDIEQRIINNGVPADNFTLTIVPNDQADQPDSQVVGHCANDTHKILYPHQQRQCASQYLSRSGRFIRRTAITSSCPPGPEGNAL